MTDEIPDCPHPDGHAWVSGRMGVDSRGKLALQSRQCRRCGYEHDFPASCWIVRSTDGDPVLFLPIEKHHIAANFERARADPSKAVSIAFWSDEDTDD